MSEDTLVIVFSGEHKSGRRLLESLQEANSSSFWNHSFFSAITALKYTGFVRPSTLFVSSSSHHLEAVRSAYAKRMLKSGSGTSIVSLGDMGTIRPVQQLHFVPLADAFCDAVAHLNRCGRAATIITVKELIARQCDQLAPPTQEMLVQTANALTKEGLVHRVGQHLFVAPIPAKTTMECQTGDSLLIPDSPPRNERKAGILARLFMRTKNGSPTKKHTKVVPLRPCTHNVIVPTADWDTDRLSPLDVVLHKTQQRNSPSHCRRQGRERRREERRRKIHEDDEVYPIHYGPIDPPENIARYKREQERRNNHYMTDKMAVSIPHKARASTPIDSSDSAYSRSPSEHSDECVDHTYMNLASFQDETRFEECTLGRQNECLLTAM